VEESTALIILAFPAPLEWDQEHQICQASDDSECPNNVQPATIVALAAFCSDSNREIAPV
jgi:hypothetical protein